MNGKRLKIYDNGELIHEAKECSVPLSTGDSRDILYNEKSKYVTIMVNGESVGLMDHRHWSDEDWGILLALIKKYQ